jgi:hypothetical protein
LKDAELVSKKGLDTRFRAVGLDSEVIGARSGDWEPVFLEEHLAFSLKLKQLKNALDEPVIFEGDHSMTGGREGAGDPDSPLFDGSESVKRNADLQWQAPESRVSMTAVGGCAQNVRLEEKVVEWQERTQSMHSLAQGIWIHSAISR